MLRTNAAFSLLKQLHTPPTHLLKANFSRCAVVAAAQGSKPKSQAHASSRKPTQSTHLEQNPHLKHATPGDKSRDKAPSDSNAANDPKLPSHKFSKDGAQSVKAGAQGKRGIHLSAAWFAEAGKGGGVHSADSYSKDVDTNEPATSTTYSVGGDDATKAHRPHEQYADPKKQYATVSKDEPYQPLTSEAEGDGGEKSQNVKESNLRYGGTEKDSEKGTSHSKESATEGNAGGRKPEGR